MDRKRASSSKQRETSQQRNYSLSEAKPSVFSYSNAPSNPDRLRQDINRVSMDQMETWERINQLERKIEKKRKMKADKNKSPGSSSNAHDKNIEELFRGLSKDEEASMAKRSQR